MSTLLTPGGEAGNGPVDFPDTMLIGGTLVRGADSMDVVNPATGGVLAVAPRASAAQVDQSIASAKAAFATWSRTDLSYRRSVLRDIADVVETNAQQLARLLTQEQGKPLADAMAEVQATATFFRHVAAAELPTTSLEHSDIRRAELHRRPLGVVAIIVPWNFPLLLMAFKVPGALLTGNTVVVKPAATTPLTTLMFARLVAQLVPGGVLNVITDANDLGGILTSHPDVAKVSFTGSTTTGYAVMANAAKTLKRVTLELGGNDPAIVLDDAVTADIAQGIFRAAFFNAGQACIAIKRLYVHASIYDELCTALAGLAAGVTVGNGLDSRTTMGPLQNRAQYEKVKHIVAEAATKGRIVSGGLIDDGDGYFIRPTIVADIEEGTRLVDEEQFGPVLPLIRYTDLDDAIQRANASEYGLGASVWSSDVVRARAVAEQLVCGSVWINQHLDLAPNIPQAGAKQSGFGVELGNDGLLEFTQIQVINVRLDEVQTELN
ncbi:aldehyde dehydrogenase family protein [Cupriavidus agavae]|uniref:Acyl-CoA reductase-like NAD-dependent aldehyde dehydrogenase n=1 Tax=Cupriavidus agavae TaxID=1001822 RepID=A0A4Q7S7Z6_9BURK|nr:aldehyde dehydrogenase family protein [Cupriavidus agavae]RZT42505.1 acyl-CoA reductase-like NAD-dependent aldehyde dehydrogenase [Cupriavidus agavae]